MIRAFSYVALLAFAIAVVVWLAGNPGQAVLEFQGYRIETSAAVLFGLVAVLSGAIALLYRLWLFLRRSPGALTGAWRHRRQRKGYAALTQGMVAVAAGDGTEAQRQARKAESLLDEPPLTMLLAAQTAQLNGDEQAAERFFKAMSEDPATEFLGLRGLLTQAMKKKDREAALKLAKRAAQIQPKSDWVSGILFDLQVETGHWLEAGVTTREQVRHKHVEKPAGLRRQGIIAYELSREARKHGDVAGETRHLKRAVDLVPDLIPAVVRQAEVLDAAGKSKKAGQLLEKTWASQPHPDLAAAYLAREGGQKDPLAAMRMVERLAAKNKDHPESHLSLARQAVGAELWGEARRHLAPVVAGGPGEGFFGQACRLMADVEEFERNDLPASKVWLTKAAMAEADRAWVCSHCANTVAGWQASCDQCGTFDSFAWRTPPHVPSAQIAPGEDAETAAGPHTALPRPGSRSSAPAEGSASTGTPVPLDGTAADGEEPPVLATNAAETETKGDASLAAVPEKKAETTPEVTREAASRTA